METRNDRQLLVSRVKLEMVLAAAKSLRRIVFMKVEKIEEDWQELQSADYAIKELEDQIEHEKTTT